MIWSEALPSSQVPDSMRLLPPTKEKRLVLGRKKGRTSGTTLAPGVAVPYWNAGRHDPEVMFPTKYKGELVNMNQSRHSKC